MLAEYDNLEALLDRFRGQGCQHFSLYICVNNVEGGFGYEDNQRCLARLREVHDLPLTILDRSSEGLGWSGKKKGVGWARKLLFDQIAADNGGNGDELVVSLDADTDFDSDYFQALLDTFNKYPECHAFDVPYYHPLSGDDSLDRAMLRYECYMRHYLIQLQRIRNPYAFSALGSAIAFPLWAYRKVGGITPLQGGEDFYLLQKFAKTGSLIHQFDEPYCRYPMMVRPQGRMSSRVPFGTGPAIAKGVEGMELSYPFFSEEAFAKVKETYDAFPKLYEHDLPTPMSDFLCQQLATTELWAPLRKNFKSRNLFVHACTERVDGLRILQYIKHLDNSILPTTALPVDFCHDPIANLDHYRFMLFEEEMSRRFNY